MREYESIKDLISMRNKAGQEYYKSNQDLEALKDKLIENGNVAKWEIDLKALNMKPSEVLQNKLVAKYLILPSQNKILNEMKTIFGYFNNTMVKEMVYISNSRAKRYIRSLGNFCSSHIDCLDSVNEYYHQQISLFTNLKNNLLEVFQQLYEQQTTTP